MTPCNHIAKYCECELPPTIEAAIKISDGELSESLAKRYLFIVRNEYQSLQKENAELREENRNLAVDAPNSAKIRFLREESARLLAKTVSLQSKLDRAVEAANSLLNKVNKVTAYHRGGNSIPTEFLDELSNRQIEVEATLAEIGEGV